MDSQAGQISKSEFFVSICVPVYNGALYLAQTLHSIVNQTYPHREIIISDNASTDATPGILREYQKRYPLKVYRNARSTPVGEYNFNRCVDLAKGDAVCVFHGDDLYAPEIVSRQVEVLQKYPSVGAVFTMAQVINEEGKSISRYSLPKELKRLKRDFYRFDEIFSVILKYENSFLVCPSPMVRKKVYDELGAWEYDKYRSASDLGLWFKIAQKYDIAIIDEPLVRYRISRQQGSLLLARLRTEPAHYFDVMESYAEMIGRHPNARYYAVSQIKDKVYRAINLSANGQIAQSQNLLKEAFGLYRREFMKIMMIPKAAICASVALIMFACNLLPWQRPRILFRAFISRLIGFKKAILSY